MDGIIVATLTWLCIIVTVRDEPNALARSHMENQCMYKDKSSLKLLRPRSVGRLFAQILLKDGIEGLHEG